ncbi:MAG: IS200/IS605 family transposase [Proteobacteria bacterium]|nr:IS200/IS605 family transposase [Pseudomonadota bacterium]
MIDNPSKLPEKCYACAKNNGAAAHKKCKLCQDLSFAESILCHLNRSVQDQGDFVCYAFRQKLTVVDKLAVKVANKDVAAADSLREEKLKRLIDSDKSKYKIALAVQRLNRDPDGVFTDLKYHFVWNVMYRWPVFAKSSDYLEFVSKLFYKGSEVVEGYAQLLWLAPDHVHIYIETDGRESVHRIIRKLKSHSGKSLLSIFPDIQEKIGISNKFWDEAYFTETIG